MAREVNIDNLRGITDAKKADMKAKLAARKTAAKSGTLPKPGYTLEEQTEINISSNILKVPDENDVTGLKFRPITDEDRAEMKAQHAAEIAEQKRKRQEQDVNHEKMSKTTEGEKLKKEREQAYAEKLKDYEKEYGKPKTWEEKNIIERNELADRALEQVRAYTVIGSTRKEEYEEWLPKGRRQTTEGTRRAICLSDIDHLRETVLLPGEKRVKNKLTKKWETVSGNYEKDEREPGKLNKQQAIRVVLDHLNARITEWREFGSYEASSIANYVERIQQVSMERLDDQDYQDVKQLCQITYAIMYVFQHVWYTKGAKGAKEGGIHDMNSAVNPLEDRAVWTLLQDPYIEAAVHKISGAVDLSSFIKGLNTAETGVVYGGNLGAFEKLGYMLSMISWLRTNQKAGEQSAAAYTAYVLTHPLEYHMRNLYTLTPVIIEDLYAGITKKDELVIERGGFVEGHAVSRDKRREVMFVMDTKPPPSAFHQRSLNGWIWENFTPGAVLDKVNQTLSLEQAQDAERGITNYGWRNAGRMLALIPGEPYRDARHRLIKIHYEGEGKERRQVVDKPLGVYTLEEFLLASDADQEKMARVAYRLYVNLQNDRILQRLCGFADRSDAIALQKRILLVNSQRIYYMREGEAVGDVKMEKWQKYSVLDYNEADGKGNRYVDIGGMTRWNSGTKNVLNASYTDWDYAYRSEGLLAIFLDSSKDFNTRLKAVMDLLSAEKGSRHLSESTMENLEERGAFDAESASRMYELGYEREAVAMHMWAYLSRIIEFSVWNERSVHTKRFEWADKINQLIPLGYDMHRFAKIFRAAGIYNRHWAGDINTLRFSESEKVGLILVQMERPDVWCVFLRGLGFTDMVKKQVLEEAGSGFRPPEEAPEEWCKIFGASSFGFQMDYWDYLAYNAMASFAGYKVIGVERGHDKTGEVIPRVKFEHAFNLDRPSDRPNGNYFKGLVLGEIEKYRGVVSGDERRELAKGIDVGWERIIIDLVGVYNKNKEWNRYGRLTESMMGAFFSFYHPLHEQKVIDTMIEGFLRDAYDKKDEHWIQGDYDRRLKSRDRWIVFGQMKRGMQYTAGDLTGEWIHDQIVTDENGVIDLNEHGLPHIAYLAEGVNRVASMSLGSTGIQRLYTWDNGTMKPDFSIVSNPKLYSKRFDGEYEELALEGIRAEVQDKIRGRHPTDEEKKQEVWNAQLEWRLRNKYPGTGDAGLEEQLSWMPIYYSKELILAFILTRYIDPNYCLEIAQNKGVIESSVKWEAEKYWQRIADPSQYYELLSFIEKMEVEDPGWIARELVRLGFDTAAIDKIEKKYMWDKNAYKIPDMDWDTKTSPTEQDLLALQESWWKNIPLVGKAIPRFGGWQEVRAFIRPFGTVLGISGGIGFATSVGIPSLITGAAVVSPLTLTTGLAIGLIPALIIGNQFVNKGFDSKANENAKRSEWQVTHGKSWLGTSMYYRRMAMRTPEAFMEGKYLHDSIIPWDKVYEKLLIKYKDLEGNVASSRSG